MLTARPRGRFLIALVFFVILGSSMGSSQVTPKSDELSIIDNLIKKENEFCILMQQWLTLRIERMYAVPQSYIVPTDPPGLSAEEKQIVKERVVGDAIVACMTLEYYQKLVDQYVERTYPRRFVSMD